MTADPKPARKRKLYEIPAGARPSRCRSCEAEIFWIETGKARLPVNPDGASHFETCPQAALWSRRKNVSDREKVNVKGCARCGKDHEGLEFMRLRRPAKDFQWWAPCPTFGEPILMRSTKEEPAT
jgi:hypothetical protein